MSRMIILDVGGNPSILIDDYDKVHDLKDHYHVYNDEETCLICTATRSELKE